MKRTPREKLNRAVRRLLDAEEQHAGMIGMHPDCHEDIEAELRKAWANYHKTVREVLGNETRI